jgi:hypothetical protein
MRTSPAARATAGRAFNPYWPDTDSWARCPSRRGSIGSPPALTRCRSRLRRGSPSVRRTCRGPDAGGASQARRETAQQAAHRLALKVKRLRDNGITSQAGLARTLTARGVPPPRGSAIWTHTRVARVQLRPRPWAKPAPCCRHPINE